jgi:hypothetical protein
VFEATTEFFYVVQRRRRAFALTKADDPKARETNYADKRLIWIVHKTPLSVIEEDPRLLAENEYLAELAQVGVWEPAMCVDELGITWNATPTYEDGRLGLGFRVWTTLLSWNEIEMLEATYRTHDT